MNFIIYGPLLRAILFVLFLLPLSSENVHARVIEKVLARIDSEIITLSDLHAFQFVHFHERSKIPPEKILLQQVIDKRLLYMAEQSHIVSERDIDAVEQVLIARLIDPDNYFALLVELDIDRQLVRNEIVRKIIVEKLIEQKIQPFIFVRPRDIESYYLAGDDKFKHMDKDVVYSMIKKLLEATKLIDRVNEFIKKIKMRSNVEIIEGERRD